MRINARLDDSYQAKLDYLTQTRQLSVSDVVRDALDAIVGMAESDAAPADLSANYKAHIAAGIEAKFPQHAHR